MLAAPFFQNFFMFAAPLQCTLVVWYNVCTTMTNGGTGTVPPLVMEMQTCSTQILWYSYKEDCQVSSTNTNQQIDD
jgi:hypothetical protein